MRWEPSGRMEDFRRGCLACRARFSFWGGQLHAVFDSESEEQTLSLGRKLGGFLSRGDVVGIKGELGAGKSVLVRGICEGLGIKQRTRSPSFTFMNRYRGPVDVYHIDLYRIGGPGDLATLGWEEVVYGEAITLIEWAEKLAPFLPPVSIEVDIEVTGEETREIRLAAVAKRQKSIIEDVLMSCEQDDERDTDDNRD